MAARLENRGSADTAKSILESVPRIADVACGLANVRWEVHRIDEREQRSAGIGAGNDRTGLNLFAAVEHDALRALVPHDHLADACARPNLRAGLSGRGGERVADRADAAACRPPGGERFAVARRHEQENRRAAGQSRAEMGSEDAPSGDGDTHRGVFEPLFRKIRDGHRQPAQEAVRVLPAERSKAAPGLQAGR